MTQDSRPMTEATPGEKPGMSIELKKRIKTAVAGVTAFILLLTLGGSFGAVIAAAAISLGTLYEFGTIAFTLPDVKEKRFVLMGCAWLFIFLNFWLVAAETSLLSLFFIGLVAYFLFTARQYDGAQLKTHYQEMTYSVFAFVYLTLLPNYLVSLRQVNNGVHWTLMFFLIVWAADSGAYFAGHRYGKNRMYPHISPGKTWEGAMGGSIAAVLISLIYKLIFFRSLGFGGAIFTALVISAFSPVGDLAESFLKRAFDKKDSSSLLPGHGGFLDRFDGVVFSLPVMYVLTRFF